MTKSAKELLKPVEGEENIKAYYKEAAMDALLYWTNSTTELCGVNSTLTLLTEMLSTCIVHMVSPGGADQAEKIITMALTESFSSVRKKSTKVSSPDSDNLN